MHGLRFYRTVFVIPYAIPGFLSLLVWQGLLNDDFGVVNRSILHTNVPWLFDANWARVSVILVSTWLTFPYFFLVSLGALQSIPAELTEAARVLVCNFLNSAEYQNRFGMVATHYSRECN